MRFAMSLMTRAHMSTCSGGCLVACLPFSWRLLISFFDIDHLFIYLAFMQEKYILSCLAVVIHYSSHYLVFTPKISNYCKFRCDFIFVNSTFICLSIFSLNQTANVTSGDEYYTTNT